MKSVLAVSHTHSVTPRVIGHKHEPHVIVLISNMGVNYKNIKFGDMENLTDHPHRQLSKLSCLNFTLLIFVKLV